MAKLAQDDAQPPPNPLNLLAAYIPAEALAVYLGALGILIPTAQATPDQVGLVRFVCFAAGVVVAVLIAFFNFTPGKDMTASTIWYRRIVVAILAVVAFTSYAAATPSFFFTNTYLTISFTQWAAAAALLIAVLLPVVAQRLGVRKA